MTNRLRFVRFAIAFALAAGIGVDAFAEDGACKPIIDAMTKQTVTPYHEYLTTTAAGKGGKSRDSESINTATMHYLEVRPGNGAPALTTGRRMRPISWRR